VSRHRFDPISLGGGVVCLGLGIVGLLRSAGWIDGGAVFWAVVVVAAGLGFVGAVCSVRGLVPTHRPPPEAVVAPTATGPDAEQPPGEPGNPDRPDADRSDHPDDTGEPAETGDPDDAEAAVENGQ